MPEKATARLIKVQGLVQGVGFRPFVYRLANQFGLSGWVNNTDDGLYIRVEGNSGKIDGFLRDLNRRAPKAADIHSVAIQECRPEQSGRFYIRKSRSYSERITQVSPDITVCEECLADMKEQPHRIDYPFTNCTHCGPRFTIIRDLPYDRKNTTMAPFVMCDTCRKEYESIEDRRFHAQPVACNRCGPEYTLIYNQTDNGSNTVNEPRSIRGIHAILDQGLRLITQGGIIAIKGLGGFHLMCDATNETAVRRLRTAKLRDGKPFAVMVRDLLSAKRYAEISPAEEELLTSWRRPIVLLKYRPDTLAPDINPGCSTVGLMLPYMPFHHLFFNNLPGNSPEAPDALVMTSGNLTDEPIVMENQSALDTFRNMADATLLYNRDIHNRTDDSVALVTREKPRIIRRSRGYVPEPVRLPFEAEGILAVGAELSHCFAVGKGNEALLSQHIGDLKDPETYAFFQESVDRLCHLFRVRPETVSCDLHPDYLSTRYARDTDLPVVEVQHHHAHVAACMAEFHLNEPVLGVCWDGTGLGSDGHIWGGEFLLADLSNFKRLAHLDYLPLPGGDKAAKEIWRTGASLLYRTYGNSFRNLELPFTDNISRKKEWNLINQAIDRKLNAPLSSAAGRLFDAVAAITGVCQYNSFHAEAPMKLEAIIDDQTKEAYSYDRKSAHALPETVLTFDSTVRSLIADLLAGVPLPVISAKFHNTLVSLICEVTHTLASHTGTGKVILTGGVFQNRYLLEKTEELLEKSFDVYSPLKIPCNDAGIALGQLAVTAGRRKSPDTKLSSNKSPIYPSQK